jgi:MFS family permease
MDSKHLPRAVVALGFVSLFMDTSSEMIHSLLPVFLVSVLGVSALTVGVIEGIAEATAAIAKVFSGVISDLIGRRKPLVLLGYGLAALSKPLFPLATGAGAVLTARFVDRLGKGIRGAPRDALIADVTPQPLRGAAYGLRQSMDTVGAVAGPAIALVLMALTANDYRFVFWIALIPALVAVAFIIFGVQEADARVATPGNCAPLRRADLARLSRRFWYVVAFACVLTLARFSEAFLLLRADSVGLVATWVPAVLIVMNAVYAASAYPFGRGSDRMSRAGLLAWGIGFLVGAHLVLALAQSVGSVIAGAALWGLHMGATQGLLSALVADATPDDLRGTAFGMFNLLTGLALLGGGVIAGGLWTLLGPAMTFYVGAAFALVAWSGLMMRAGLRC